jgi:hypothetical protein
LSLFEKPSSYTSRLEMSDSICKRFSTDMLVEKTELLLEDILQ